ncbi:cytochrome P450 [Colletotrichum falcatum]|nr:cytochrome P450 [Colletotrichum falcatum]
MATQNTGFAIYVLSFNMAIMALFGFMSLSSALVYVFGFIVYNVYFHPLGKYPDPELWATKRIPYTRSSLSGLIHRKILELHREYGPIVRVAPDELSYNHPDGWKDLHGYLKNRTGDHGRDPVVTHDARHSVVGAGLEDHSRFRRARSYGFPAQSMLDQQPIIKAQVDLLIQRLHEKCAGGSDALDMVSWYNWTTFKVVGDLSFGEPFHRLDNSDYRPWVELIFDSINLITFDELKANLASLIAAGSETTATALSGITYYLLANADSLGKLNDEIRNEFASEAEIDMISVRKLVYMQAVISEGMRMYPAAPSGLPRRVTGDGGVFLSRLAYVEMRVIPARVLWNFDMKLAEGSRGWDERSRTYKLWEKGPLMVHLTTRILDSKSK